MKIKRLSKPLLVLIQKLQYMMVGVVQKYLVF
ncbi:hypothetical protein Nmel_007814 [Mimus melanotis]